MEQWPSSFLAFPVEIFGSLPNQSIFYRLGESIQPHPLGCSVGCFKSFSVPVQLTWLVHIAGRTSDLFPVGTGLWQCCPLLPYLFLAEFLGAAKGQKVSGSVVSGSCLCFFDFTEG